MVYDKKLNLNIVLVRYNVEIPILSQVNFCVCLFEGCEGGYARSAQDHRFIC